MWGIFLDWKLDLCDYKSIYLETDDVLEKYILNSRDKLSDLFKKIASKTFLLQLREVQIVYLYSNSLLDIL